MTTKVWLITGGSKGLGLELTKLLLANNQKVMTTSRNKEELVSKIGSKSNDFLPIILSLTDEKNVQEIVNWCRKIW